MLRARRSTSARGPLSLMALVRDGGVDPFGLTVDRCSDNLRLKMAFEAGPFMRIGMRGSPSWQRRKRRHAGYVCADCSNHHKINACNRGGPYVDRMDGHSPMQPCQASAVEPLEQRRPARRQLLRSEKPALHRCPAGNWRSEFGRLILTPKVPLAASKTRSTTDTVPP